MGVIMHKRESYPKNGGGTSEMSDIFNAVYPVGSIYMSVNNVNPGLLFGGTWEAWGVGRVPIGVDTNDEDFDTVEETGGSKTHVLTVEEIPVHNHAFTGTRTTTENYNTQHRHYNDFNTNNQSANHTHDFTTNNQSNSHVHPSGLNRGTSGSGYGLVDSLNATSTGTWSTGQINANHTHTGTTGNNKANHAHRIQQWGGYVNNTAYNAAINHNHWYTAAGTIGDRGGGAAHTIMNPYITCFMWKRIE